MVGEYIASYRRIGALSIPVRREFVPAVESFKPFKLLGFRMVSQPGVSGNVWIVVLCKPDSTKTACAEKGPAYNGEFGAR
jgi:hypothetical protein